MRAARAIWRFLSHPALSTLGNVTLLVAAIPIGIAVLTAVVGWILDQPTLFWVAIGLATLGMAFVAIVAVRQRSLEGPTTPSAGRAQSDETRLRPRVFIDVEGEIAFAYEETLHMAKILRAEPPHTAVDSAVVKTMLPDWRAKTTAFIAAVLGSAQRAAFRGSATGGDDLDCLESEGQFLCSLAVNLPPDAIRASAAEVRTARAQRRDNQAAGLFSYETPSALETPPSPDLAEPLDSLMHEGIDLVGELSVPVEPTKANGGWKLEGGDAPDEWWDKADAFTQGIRELLIERHPALLTDFRDGFNGYLKQEREAQRARNADPSQDKRSTAAKMLDLANFERSGPKRVVEASLEGLAAARHRLNVPQA